MLFVLGGNGTHAGANAIHNEVFNPLTLLLVNCICNLRFLKEIISLDLIC